MLAALLPVFLACAVPVGALAAQQQAAALQDVRLADLPLVEIPATAEPAPAAAGRLAVVLSGDGGWASLDRSIATEFARRGIPVVGIDSLRYFWKLRTPEQTAGDVAAVIAHYLVAWHRTRVDLVGYSFGADVLPFVANRLPADMALRLATITMVEPSLSATFEIHVSDWLPGTTDARPAAGAGSRRSQAAAAVPAWWRDADTICSHLPAAQVEQIGKGPSSGRAG